MERYDYSILFEKISKCKQAVVFGYSEIGQSFCDEIEEKYPNKVVCFCDNDKKKWGKTYKGYEVKNVLEIKEKFSTALIVITSQNYSDIIEKQLIDENGFSSENIIIYRKKDEKYIQNTDKKFWGEIKEDISQDSISWNEVCDLI